MPTEVVTLEGHIIDSLILPKVLDEIVELGANYEIVDLRIGRSHQDESFAKIRVTAASEGEMAQLLDHLRNHGANPETVEDALLAIADIPGAFPPGFYSTTNLETEVRIEGKWLHVEHCEMDCGVVVDEERARTIAMSEVRPGMPIVVGGRGIRVTPLEKPRLHEGWAFEFMGSEVSSEKPKALLVERVAREMRSVRASGKRILWVVGPAVVHTGSGPDLCDLIRSGYVQALFAGNGVAAHDIESNVFGTSLGVHLEEGSAVEHGHEHHIRAINEVRRHGSFKAAIDSGMLSDGIVYHLVTRGVEYLFGGSVRDDGPLPEVVTDMLEVQRKLRAMIWGRQGEDLIGLCIVAGTMLHGIATGNCLPASVPLISIDIQPATATKLMDRGSWQSLGIITDVGLFLRELAARLNRE
ncbi:MAG: TIGR00300 family protein [Gemmatimonadota bacterium]